MNLVNQTPPRHDHSEVKSVSKSFKLLGQSRQGLDWIIGQVYSFGVFSASQLEIVLIFHPIHFFVTDGGSQLTF